MKRYSRTIFLSPISLLLWRLIAGGLLFYASFDKIWNPGAFAEAIKTYDILPVEALRPFIWLVPRVELYAGGFLVLGLLRRPSAVVCGGLYAMFIVAIAQALVRSLSVEDCGCGIVPGEGLSWLLVLRDVALLAMCAPGFFVRRDPLTVDRLLFRKAEPPPEAVEPASAHSPAGDADR